MSRLTIFGNKNPNQVLFTSEIQNEIRGELHKVGVRFEQWSTDPTIGPHSSHEAILAAYNEPIQRLVREVGYQSWDVVALDSNHPNKVVLRQKFLSEHTHQEDEVRFFVAGSGLFTLHIDGQVYSVLCERGDFISVPAKVYHWFDMGSSPHFIAIRLFNNPDGWIAEYTGSEIADLFPKMI